MMNAQTGCKETSLEKLNLITAIEQKEGDSAEEWAYPITIFFDTAALSYVRSFVKDANVGFRIYDTHPSVSKTTGQNRSYIEAIVSRNSYPTFTRLLSDLDRLGFENWIFLYET